MNNNIKYYISGALLGFTIFAAIQLPSIWLADMLLLDIWVALFYLYLQLKRRVSEEFEKYNIKFVESGNAITDTLKVAFDNIKKTSTEQQRLNAKLREYNSKLHRVEQHQHRLASIGIKKGIDARDKLSEEARTSRPDEVQSQRRGRTE